MNVPIIACVPIFWTLLMGAAGLYLHLCIYTLEA
jgi:hypothetical protein